MHPSQERLQTQSIVTHVTTIKVVCLCNRQRGEMRLAVLIFCVQWGALNSAAVYSAVSRNSAV